MILIDEPKHRGAKLRCTACDHIGSDVVVIRMTPGVDIAETTVHLCFECRDLLAVMLGESL